MDENTNYFHIKTTNDGSCSIYSNIQKALFHSIHGAYTESNHIFIENGLKHSLKNLNTINILEMGIGSGLNALLTWNYFQSLPNITCRYTGIEDFPLPIELVKQINYQPYSPNLPSHALLTIHQSNWNEFIQLSPNFHLNKIKANILLLPLTSEYHLIYYDAFAPEAQPELWTPEIFEKLFNALLPFGSLITYCAKGYVKRNLKQVGFEIESLPGPPGKREITRAIKIKES